MSRGSLSKSAICRSISVGRRRIAGGVAEGATQCLFRQVWLFDRCTGRRIHPSFPSGLEGEDCLERHRRIVHMDLLWKKMHKGLPRAVGLGQRISMTNNTKNSRGGNCVESS